MNQFAIREAQATDLEAIKSWLSQPNVLQWFPMETEKEVDDAARFWVNYHYFGACFIATVDDIPCGTVLLNITLFSKIKHQCLLSIIVSENFRNQGIGTKLLQFIEKVALEKFQIELLHLEVYENNPAKRLYDRMGYVQYGIHPEFLKEANGYRSKILMQKWLVDRKGMTHGRT
jgi:ribosomal protein S18 acetylase RimI-like enzyme